MILRTRKEPQEGKMTRTEKLLIIGCSAFSLLFAGCAGGYYGGGDEVPYYGGHYFYGQSFGARHFASAHGSGGGHSGGGHGGGGHSGGGGGHGGGTHR
jgi:hypothetical protein